MNRSHNMEIVKANMAHKAAFGVYVEKCVKDGLDLYKSAIHDSEAYLEKRIAYAEGRMLPEGWPPISLYFCVESERIIGAIRVRHGTNDYIENEIGHIGYETLSQSRGKGVATKMLSWVLDNVIEQRVVMTCDIDNKASAKVITKCGGVYLNTVYSDEDACYIQRFAVEK